MRTSTRRGAIGAILAAAILAACGSGGGTNEGPDVVIGAQNFGESSILAEIYRQALADAGYTASVQQLGGFRDLVISSFESGDINFTPEYAASMLEFLNGFAGQATSDAQETSELLRGELEAKDLTAFDPAPAVDTNSFVVTGDTASAVGLANLSDLAEKGSDFILGGVPDCPTNAFCLPGLQSVYGLDLSEGFVALDGGGPLTVAALESGDIDVGILFSTSSTIADKGWVRLEDDKGMLAADNVIPVMTTEVADAYGAEFRDLVDAVSAAMSTEELTELNRRFDIDHEDAAAIATDWLTTEGLIGG
ncbi:MAG TPA: ABC transporter substrate-binding protein [Acidimicrobiia bacterium]|jgi:osmoprotectant transport system substrate-binding protein